MSSPTVAHVDVAARVSLKGEAAYSTPRVRFRSWIVTLVQLAAWEDMIGGSGSYISLGALAPLMPLLIPVGRTVGGCVVELGFRLSFNPERSMRASTLRMRTTVLR